MNHRFVAVLATAAACLSSIAAQAETRDPVTARVSYAGLDLDSVEGRRLLDTRIEIAARRACVSQATGSSAVRDVRRCRSEMIRDGAVRVAQVMQRAQLASVR
jgi:UrcA family protein